MGKLEQYKLKKPHPKLQNCQHTDLGNIGFAWHFIFVEVLLYVTISETHAFAWQSDPVKEYFFLLALGCLNNCCNITRAKN